MKSVKKYLACFMAAVLMCGMGTTVLAADTEITNPGDGNTQVVATTSLPGQPTYTITIPSTIDLGSITRTEASSIKSQAFEVKATDVADMDGKQVNVSVSTADGNFNLMKDTVALPFKVFNQAADGTALASGDIYTSFTANNSVPGRIEVDQKDITAAGTYTGTVTFTIALADRAN